MPQVYVSDENYMQISSMSLDSFLALKHNFIKGVTFTIDPTGIIRFIKYEFIPRFSRLFYPSLHERPLPEK